MATTTDLPLTKLPKRVWKHVILAIVAVVFAVAMWTRDKQPKALAAGDVTVWSGKPSDVMRIRYETKTRKVALESKKDGEGRYFVGTVDREAAPEGDAGPAPKPPIQTFVSVGSGQKLAESLAPLKALRALGSIPDARAAEFGLSEPEGTLTVTIGGTERKLIVGGPTPGGADRYVKESASGEAFAIKGDIVRDLDGAESRLLERDLHEWKDNEITGVKISSGSKWRAVIRSGPETKRFWADPSAPDTNDETIGNWMSKIDRLRPLEYVEVANKESVVRLEYSNGRKTIGWLELFRAPGANGKADYFIVSERTRLAARVTQSVGEQVEQDLSGIVR